MDWWLTKVPDNLVEVFTLVLMAALIIYPLYRWRRARVALGPRDEEGRVLGIEDPEALAKAEDWAKTYDYRKDWADRGYVILEEFDSLHGFTATYMADLLAKMEAQGLRVVCDSIQGTPAGVVTINQGHSLHILHCHKEDFQQARQYLDTLFK